MLTDISTPFATGLLEHALVRDATPGVQLGALEALLEAGSGAPAAFAARYGPRLPWLRGFLAHTDAAGVLPYVIWPSRSSGPHLHNAALS